MANWVDFDIDIKEVEKALKDTKLNINTVIIKMQKAVNKEVIKSAKARFRSLFNVNNHSTYTLTSPNSANNAGKDAQPVLKNFKNIKNKREKRSTWILNNTYYANWLEKGVTINAKNKKYLRFKVNGEWKSCESVTVPARPFVQPAVDEFWNSSKHIEIQEKVLKKELEKYWEKHRGEK
jgi:hypothetical protein